MRWPELKTGLWAGALCLVLAQPAAVEAQGNDPLRLSRDEARTMAQTLLGDGQPAAAREIALGLFQADPDDILALILLAQAATAMGNEAEARQAIRAAWAKSDSPEEKFLTAVMRARLSAQSDRLTVAQYWLRRAADLAPNPTTAALVAQDYAAVRAENPLRVQLAATATPSTNVNNGSANATTTFEGIPFVFELSPEARALSGATAEISANLRYRIARSDRSETLFTLDGLGRQVWLSREAQAAAPDADRGNYAYSAAGVGLTHRFVATEGALPYVIGLRAERSWYAGAPFTEGLSLSLSHEVTPDDTTRLGFNAQITRTHYLRDDEWAMPVTLGASWARALANSDVLSGGLTLGQSFADQEDRRYRSVSVNIGYEFGQVLAGIDLSARLSHEWRSYDSAFTGSDLRQDRRLSATLSAGLSDVDLFGFQPVLTIEAARNLSNVDLYETESLNTGLAFRSSF